MNKKTVLILAALLLLPPISQADIVQRVQITGINPEQDSEGADVLTLAGDGGCGGRQVRMDAHSLGMDTQPYAAMKIELAGRIHAKTPLLLTIGACPVGEVGEVAVPVVRKLVGCNPAACADGKARLYLSEKLFPQEKRRSPYMLVLPLPPARLAGTWKVEIVVTSGPGKIRLSGQVDAADYVSGKLVGGYVMYYTDGKIEKQVAQDMQGRQDGVSSTYYPDGTLESRGDWRHGLPEGPHQHYHGTGKLREEVVYRDGKRIDGPGQTFDENGKLSTSYVLRDGKMEGELLSYFPNGKVASRAQMSKGKFNGLSTDYDDDGAVRSTMMQSNDLPVGEALEFYPDGKVQTRQQYGEQGALRSIRRYSPQGVLVLQRDWDEKLREQGTSRSWYASGKPEHAIEYVNDRREGWSRSWGDDGSVISECRYVAGEAQGACAAEPQSTELLQREQAWRAL
ncbi:MULTISPECIES: toxin-antitoxin system YwqK family antitoxin [unclassified Janthinobacterium]|uniref:toxin-antitoxin system YwqK family antitoxin n=1 Tax=unclassified Janthinobacterium TaxID=2610881 RepID=UPI0016092F4E|nr:MULTISPECIES: toxin-antitoxin system YwqK family antitoxin [unclassified Janthinobacterium]MBB5369859.1 hypothetical protein [Janthinobacterium sp. K2C7]MBB5382665.1 hypothetical protein [Janthinobacterium sp. K2Li3]MBB5384650.1 hypothetical protein [Janthinobacterium sp. K2E3]